MHLIVCMKPVPKPGTVKVDPETQTLKRESAELLLNPPDLYALEMAVQLKEKHGGKVTALMMGPPNAAPLLREAYALGADEMVLLSDRAFAGSDTLATSYILSRAILRLEPFDLVLMGKASIDGETAQVGPETGAWLGVPSIVQIRDLRREGERWVATRITDGFEEDLEWSGPAVLTVEPEANQPRPPSLKRLLGGRNLEPRVLSAEDLRCDPEKLGLSGSPTRVLGVFAPSYEKERVVLSGEPEEVVEELVSLLASRGLI
ncbi:electron transfer flavoprotein subunit beta/FixA family protein [Thermosulfurimonas sp. F29]|uniref:electron transfer flavoprotein subunit beta/FixA family protein n=1 Tax=Thermosulfurimonas sp. F29 TaxID=2867247 RepID=UPI001C83911D|nr:electron transfer flavoprotein subunit beta/FixA family protein [Thermosulfurimonas sp. F29]MBX6424087.1 electron transfer flavoprotein subunit beta/FixA family protein [Thermosulfurimonas sp. F29]